MSNLNKSQTVREYLKELSSDTKARVNAHDVGKELGFPVNDIFYDLRKGENPILICVGQIKIGKLKPNEYKINPDASFDQRSKFDVSTWSQKQVEIEQASAEVFWRMFDVMFKKWPDTTVRRVCIPPH